MDSETAGNDSGIAPAEFHYINMLGRVPTLKKEDSSGRVVPLLIGRVPFSEARPWHVTACEAITVEAIQV